MKGKKRKAPGGGAQPRKGKGEKGKQTPKHLTIKQTGMDI